MNMFKSQKMVLNKGFLIRIFIVSCIFSLFFFTSGCYYDSQEYLYPNTTCTDTLAPVTYSGVIQAIMNDRCVQCHNGSDKRTTILLTTYESVVGQVTSGNALLHSVMQDGSVPGMPLDGAKLDDCKLQAIIIWINKGTPK